MAAQGDPSCDPCCSEGRRCRTSGIICRSATSGSAADRIQVEAGPRAIGLERPRAERFGALIFHCAYCHSPATAILRRLPFSSDYHSPAPTILQRLPFSSAYHSPVTTILHRLPFSSDYHSPATTILQRLPFSSDSHSPVSTILQCIPFSSVYPL